MNFLLRSDAHRSWVTVGRGSLAASRRPRGAAGILCVVSASVQSSRRSAHVFGDFMKRLIIAACTAVSLLALASSAQADTDASNFSELRIAYQRFVLPNGLTLIIHEEDRKSTRLNSSH